MYSPPDAILAKIPCMKSMELKLALNIAQQNIKVDINFKVNTKFSTGCDMVTVKRIRNCTFQICHAICTVAQWRDLLCDITYGTSPFEGSGILHGPRHAKRARTT